MKKKNYLSIRNLDELEQAIAGTDEQLRTMRKHLKRHYQLAKGFYTPTALLGEGIRRAGTSVPFYGVLLTILGRLRKRSRKLLK